MALGDKLADQSVKDLNLGISQNLRELEAILHGLINRLGGAKITISIELPSWSPKA